MSKNVGGRPKSTGRCPTCGALPSRQLRRVQPPPAAERPTRYFVAAVRLPDGGMRALYMHSEANANAAKLALWRDPTLIDAIQADESEYIPPPYDRSTD